MSRDRRARRTLALFVAGPVIWAAHFMLVYLVVEAGCTGDGPGLRLFNPPVPAVVTLAATAVAALATLACAWGSARRWRASPDEPEAGDLPEGLPGDDHRRSLAFIGLLLSSLSFVSILFVGLPALVFSSC